MHEAKTVMREGPKHNNGFIERPRIAVESPAACWLLSVELKLEKGKIEKEKIRKRVGLSVLERSSSVSLDPFWICKVYIFCHSLWFTSGLAEKK
jgi:hypothetical protein